MPKQLPTAVDCLCVIPVLSKSHQTDHVETVVNGIQTLAPRCGAAPALAVQHGTEVPGASSSANSAQIELCQNKLPWHRPPRANRISKEAVPKQLPTAVDRLCVIPVLSKSHQTDHVETVVNGILAPRCGAAPALAVQHGTEVPGASSSANSAQIELCQNKLPWHRPPRANRISKEAVPKQLPTAVDRLCVIPVLSKSHQTDHVETVVNGIQTLAPRWCTGSAARHRGAWCKFLRKLCPNWAVPKQTPLTSATKRQQNKQRSRAKATSNSSWSLVRDTCVIKKSSNWPRWNCCQRHPNPGTSVRCGTCTGMQHGTEVPGASSSANSAQIELYQNKLPWQKLCHQLPAVPKQLPTAVDRLCVIPVLSKSHQTDHVVSTASKPWHLGAVHWQCSTAPRCLVQVPLQTLPKLSCAKTNSPDIGHQEPTE